MMKYLVLAILAVTPLIASDPQTVGPVTIQVEKSPDSMDRMAMKYRIWIDTTNELTDAFQLTMKYLPPRQPGIRLTRIVTIPRARAAGHVPTYYELSFRANIVSVIVEEVIYEKTSTAEFGVPD